MATPLLNLAQSIHQQVKSTFQPDGTLRARFVHGIETSFTFTIEMNDAYDYNLLGEIDPDDFAGRAAQTHDRNLQVDVDVDVDADRPGHLLTM